VKSILNRHLSLAATFVLAMGLSACRVGPNYTRPAVPAPPAFRGADSQPPTAETTGTAALGDQKWWEVFQDPQLQELIRKALQQNYDARIAAERVVQAQAQLGVTRADQYPEIDANASIGSQRYSKAAYGTDRLVNTGSLGLSATWNLDFWGKYRRATEASRAQLLSYEWAKRAVMDTVVMNIATDYFQLRTLDLELEITKRTLESRKQSLKLTQTLEAGGSTTMLDVRQAEQLVYTSQAQIPDLERQIEQQENALSTLLGENPHSIVRGISLEKQPHLPSVPVGIPSDLLERRPDIREAEENLIAANAEIGVARAAYFPSISLTGSASTESNALTRLFTGPNSAWSYGPSVSVPIFNANRTRNNVRVAESQERQSLLSYQQTIANAFRDVSNALVAYRKYQEYRTQEEQLVASAKDAARISQVRYEGGQSAYLDVLTNETNYLSAELTLATARQNELLSLVQLYNSLGGGWQQ